MGQFPKSHQLTKMVKRRLLVLKDFGHHAFLAA